MIVQVDDDFADQMIASSLKDTYKFIGSKQTMAIFDTDPKINKQEIKRYREAFALVHNWYTPADKHIKTKG